MWEWDGSAFFSLCLVGLDKDWAWAFWVMIYPAVVFRLLCEIHFVGQEVIYPISRVALRESEFQSQFVSCQDQEKGGGTGR